MKWKATSAAVLCISAVGCGEDRPAGEPSGTAVVAGLPASMEFVTIPGGTFIMGSPEGEEGRRENEGPQLQVSLEPFELMTTPVTWSMWIQVMGSGSIPEGLTGEHPATGMTWLETWEFLERLHLMDPGHFYRLPGEAEWEYACRAGTVTRFYWGDSEEPEVLDRYCWYWGNSEGASRPVGLLEPNTWGLYDMSGNVLEWCHDTWNPDHEGAPPDGSFREDPDVPFRVVRGGGHRSDPSGCRSAYRFSYGQLVRSMATGFRVARVPR